MRLPIMLAVLASMVNASPVVARSSETTNAAVLTLVRAFSNARARFDTKALDALLTPDYIEVSPRGEVDRRSAVLGFYKSDKATSVPPMTLATQDVRSYGDTAIVIGSVEYAVPGPGGGTVNRTVRVTYVERRVGGRWLMASSQYTGVKPPLPAQ